MSSVRITVRDVYVLVDITNTLRSSTWTPPEIEVRVIEDLWDQ